MLLEPVFGHSRVVSLTKIALLAVAFILIASLIILPLTSQVNKNFRLTFSSVEKGVVGEMPKMINPHLQGVDSNDQTYNITAKTAIQDKMERMILKDINADINLKNDGWVSIKAQDGVFDHAKKQMDLKGNITIFNNEGYEFTTDEAYADMKSDVIYGNTKISGQGPMGNIAADGFSVENKGERIILKGNVKVTIFRDGIDGKSDKIIPDKNKECTGCR